jgi:hypothetical protein
MASVAITDTPSPSKATVFIIGPHPLSLHVPE